MKQPPKAFTELLEKEAEESRIATEHYDRKQAKIKADQTSLYDRIAKALDPYNDVLIDDHRIVVTKLPAKLELLLLINGTHWMTFHPKITRWRCSCEAPCDHEDSTWVIMLIATQHRKDGTDYDSYFQADEPYNKETQFASAMKEVLLDFHWEYELR